MTLKAMLSAALFVLAGPVHAATYECDLKAYTVYGWIPPKMMLIIADDRSKALVYDTFIEHLYKEPIPAKIKVRKPTLLEFAWKVRNLPTGQRTQKVNVDYVSVLNTATMKVTIRAFTYVHAYAPNGGGTCKQVK